MAQTKGFQTLGKNLGTLLFYILEVVLTTRCCTVEASELINALSGIVLYAHCGDIYLRIKWNNRGCKSTVWRCVSRVEKDGPDCSARIIPSRSGGKGYKRSLH